MRSQLISACILLLLILNFQLASQTFAQDEMETSGAVSEQEKSADNQPVLPSDFPSRETFEQSDETQGNLGPGAVDFVKVIVALLVVSGLAWGLSVLLKRFVTVRGLAGTSESLKVLYTLSLSPTRTLYLVRLGERLLLIGSGEGGMRTLSEITDPREVSEILRELEFKGNYELNPFRKTLKDLSGEIDDSNDMEDLDTRQRRIKTALDKLKDSADDE